MKSVVRWIISIALLAAFATPAISAPSRTVILIYGQTQPGQDMFLRGGYDFNWSNANRGTACTSTGGDQNKACSVPITHLNTNPDTAAWRAGDNYLDWGKLTAAADGREATQTGTNSRGVALGTPAVWTTSDKLNAKKVEVDGYGYTPLNTYGDHYWMLDVNIDCATAASANGWFEFKSFISNGPAWESNVTQTQFGGFAPPPYTSGNHFARCGMLNVFQRSVANPLAITAFPNIGPTACFSSSPSNPKPGDTVTLDAGCSSNATNYRWNVGNDASIEQDWTASKTFSYIFTSAGSYPVNLDVRDSLAKTASVVNSISVAAQANTVRTVIYIQQITQFGQNIYIRGGHDLSLVSGGKYSSAFEPISSYKNTVLNSLEKNADSTLDWDTDSLLNWTTSYWGYPSGPANTYRENGYGYDPENQSGPNFWKFDVNMPGNVGDWFEFKAVIKQAGAMDQWETNRNQIGAPFASGNHWARKGYITTVLFNNDYAGYELINTQPTAPTASCVMTPATGIVSVTPFALSCADSKSNDNTSPLLRFDFQGNGQFTNWDNSRYVSKILIDTVGEVHPVIEVKNGLGLVSSVTLSVNITGATSAPVACLVVTPASGTLATPFKADASCSTNAAQYRFKYDDGAYGAWQSSSGVETQFSATGTHTISVEVKNADGLTASASQSVNVTADLAPVACLAVTPSSGSISTVFAADASCSKNATEYHFNFDGGAYGAWGATPTTTKQFATAGAHTIGVEVKNAAGLTASTTQAVNVTTTGPSAKCSVTPTTGTTADTFVFSATGSQNATDYRWDWERDDTYETDYQTALTASHVFTSSGRKYVQLQARGGGDLTSTCVVTLDVTEAASPEKAREAVTRHVWSEFGSAIKAGNVTRSLGFIAREERTRYAAIIDAIGLEAMATTLAQIKEMRRVDTNERNANFAAIRNVNGENIVNFVTFTRDADDVWRISGM